MTTHRFGGSWTADKLERVRKYLVAYTTIFNKNKKAQFLTSIYVDAFAGTGSRGRRKRQAEMDPLFEDPDRKGFLKGSARIALEVEPPFKRYLFIENNPKYALELQKLKEQFPDKAGRVRIVQEEANSYLKKWCAATDWSKCRAVVFLDPYGMEVEWSLLEALGKTKAVDLWMLFPLGIAVNRMLTRNEPPPEEWTNWLTKLFGTEEWKEAFYPTRVMPSLFGDTETQVKDADFERISRFFIDRLKTVFADVAPRPLPLRNSRNSPLYLLCFAVGNPRVAKTALGIASHILSK
jgi:three-Cys-motif partner protein